MCWPRDLLPQDLPNVRIITWGYDADVANVFKQSGHASIFGHAQSFLRDIARLRQKAEEVSPRTETLIYLETDLNRKHGQLYLWDIVWVGSSLKPYVFLKLRLYIARSCSSLRHSLSRPLVPVACEPVPKSCEAS